MGGIGGKGKGARRRQKLKENAKVFDKKTGSFREPKIELIDGQVSREELLKAPSSFRRFMEATRRAKEMRDRRDERARVARGGGGGGGGAPPPGGPPPPPPRNKKRVTNAKRETTLPAAASLTRTTRPRIRGFVRTRATAARVLRTTSRSKKPRTRNSRKRKRRTPSPPPPRRTTTARTTPKDARVNASISRFASARARRAKLRKPREKRGMRSSASRRRLRATETARARCPSARRRTRRRPSR